MSKTHWKKHFNPDYLGSYALDPGKDKVLTIKEVKQENVKGKGGKSELLLVAHFVEKVKPMILNKTNCKVIQGLYTPFIEDWKGKTIQIYSANVDAFGEKVDALRVRDFLSAIKLDNNAALKLLNSCKSLDELKNKYTSLSSDLQRDKAVLNLKNSLKNKLK